MCQRNRFRFSLLIMLLLAWALAGCGQPAAVTFTPTPEYAAQTITLGGELAEPLEVTVGEMLTLPQTDVDETFSRTTGLTERFIGTGPALADVLAYKGINYDDYKAVGVTGLDGYYCLMTPELVSERRLVLALTENNGQPLSEELRPARLCALGEFGPYWVKMVDRIDLYETIPEKKIEFVWVFANLAAGIEPYEYEYYGSKDNAIELAQIFSRFEQVDNKALFTMASSDGFIKHESFNVVSSRYYIKTEGEDAPMNVSPDFKLGMNVKQLAWISTNADAAVFPEEMSVLVGEQTIGDRSGIALDFLLLEVGVENIEERQFELKGTDGEVCLVNGEQLAKGILTTADDGVYPVYWEADANLPEIGNLLRIRAL